MAERNQPTRPAPAAATASTSEAAESGTEGLSDDPEALRQAAEAQVRSHTEALRKLRLTPAHEPPVVFRP